MVYLVPLDESLDAQVRVYIVSVLWPGRPRAMGPLAFAGDGYGTVGRDDVVFLIYTASGYGTESI